MLILIDIDQPITKLWSTTVFIIKENYLKRNFYLLYLGIYNFIESFVKIANKPSKQPKDNY